jgi:hypothetical protein
MAGKSQRPVWRICHEIALQESRALRSYPRAGRLIPSAAPTSWPWSPQWIDCHGRLHRSELLPDATDRSDQPHMTGLAS